MPRKQPLLVTTDLLEMLIDNYRYFLFSEHDFKNICFYLGDNILPLTVTCVWLINGEGKQGLLEMNCFRGWTENLVLSILLLLTSVQS